MRAILALFAVGLMFSASAPAFAQAENPVIYAKPEFGFQATFPEEPMMREIAYANEDGSEVTAHQFFVTRGINEYVVTVVSFPDGPEIDFDAFDHAVVQIRAKGEVRADFEVSYDPGIPGWQLSLSEPDGRLHRASIYMYKHRLVMAEAITEPSDLEGMRMEQSLVLLEADGSLVDTGSGNEPVVRP